MHSNLQISVLVDWYLQVYCLHRLVRVDVNGISARVNEDLDRYWAMRPFHRGPALLGRPPQPF